MQRIGPERRKKEEESCYTELRIKSKGEVKTKKKRGEGGEKICRKEKRSKNKRGERENE